MSAPQLVVHGERANVVLTRGSIDLGVVGRSLPGTVRVLVIQGDWGVEGLGVPEWLADADLVSVAQLEGRVAATGLASACDLRVAAQDATFAFGPLPEASSALVEAVAGARALHWCLAGTPVTAQVADAAGWLSAVVPAPDLGTAVDALIAAVLALPRDAVIETKALLRGAVRRTAGEQWKAEAEARARALHEE